jgi:hypothetical protein
MGAALAPAGGGCHLSPQAGRLSVADINPVSTLLQTLYCAMSCQELSASMCNLLELFTAPCTDEQAAREFSGRAFELARLSKDWTGEGPAGELEALTRSGLASAGLCCLPAAWKSPPVPAEQS